MKELFYKIRKYFLYERRRYRPGLRNFWLNFRKDVLFRSIVLTIFIIVLLAVTFVLLITVLPDNPIKAYVRKDLKIVEMSPSPTHAPTLSPSSSLEPSPAESTTPEPSPEITFTPDPNASPTPLPVDGELETTTGYVIAPSGLVVRTGPSTQHTKLGTLPYGSKVEIINQQDSWYFIVYEDGAGYIHSNYVEVGSPPADITG